MATTSQNQLLDSIKNSLSSGTYSDMSITCGGDTYNLHKVIVCNRASFFAGAIRFGGQESQSGRVDLPDDEPEIVKLLVQYLYEGDYKPQPPPTDVSISTVAVSAPVQHGNLVSQKSGRYPVIPRACTCQYDDLNNSQPFAQSSWGSGWGTQHRCTCNSFGCKPSTVHANIGFSSHLLTHSKMYQIADKYEVVGLKELSKEKFNSGCKRFWNTPDFHVAASHVFSTTPEDDSGLRDVVSRTIAKNMRLTEVPEIRTLLMDYNGLALGILDAKSKELGWHTREQVLGS